MDLPDELHRQAKSLARDRGTSLSQALVELVRRGLGQEGGPIRFERDASTGLVVTHLGQVVSSEDVRTLDDEP